MRRRDKAGGKATKKQRLKTLKRLKASKIARRRKSIATGKETNVKRLTRELAGAVTEQEQLTQELLRREAYLAEAQRLSQTGSWAWSPEEGITYWSEECYRVLSFDPQGGLPQHEDFIQRLHPDDQPAFRELIQTVSREKTEFEADYRIVHLDGPVRDIHVVGHPVLSTSGHLVEFVGTVIDVTERRRAEQERARLPSARGRSGTYQSREHVRGNGSLAGTRS